jgi:hypothetical protein
MAHACWIPKATNTLGVRNTHFPLQKWSRDRTSMLGYTFIACFIRVENISFVFLFPVSLLTIMMQRAYCLVH